MALILSIETATKSCSVALNADQKVLSSSHIYLDKSHSEHLASLIMELLDHNNIGTKALNAVAVSTGPGSYTGLRIGLSTAKGICFASDIPLIGINTLKAMAHQVNQHNVAGYHLCPMIDARRMEVYTAIYDEKLNNIIQPEARIIEMGSFDYLLKNNSIIFFGNGMPKSMPYLEKDPGAFFIPDLHPSAESIGYLAFEKYKKRDYENTNTFEPYYLKEFMATKPRKLL